MFLGFLSFIGLLGLACAFSLDFCLCSGLLFWAWFTWLLAYNFCKCFFFGFYCAFWHFYCGFWLWFVALVSGWLLVFLVFISALISNLQSPARYLCLYCILQCPEGTTLQYLIMHHFMAQDLGLIRPWSSGDFLPRGNECQLVFSF